MYVSAGEQDEFAPAVAVKVVPGDWVAECELDVAVGDAAIAHGDLGFGEGCVGGVGFVGGLGGEERVEGLGRVGGEGECEQGGVGEGEGGCDVVL